MVLSFYSLPRHWFHHHYSCSLTCCPYVFCCVLGIVITHIFKPIACMVAHLDLDNACAGAEWGDRQGRALKLHEGEAGLTVTSTDVPQQH